MFINSIPRSNNSASNTVGCHDPVGAFFLLPSLPFLYLPAAPTKHVPLSESMVAGELDCHAVKLVERFTCGLYLLCHFTSWRKIRLISKNIINNTTMHNLRYFFEQISKNRQFHAHHFDHLRTIKNGLAARLKPPVNMTSTYVSPRNQLLASIPIILSQLWGASCQSRIFLCGTSCRQSDI